MSGKYYYFANGKRLGPIDLQEMMRLKMNGEVVADTPMWRDLVQGDGKPASEFTEVFPGLPPIPTPQQNVPVRPRVNHFEFDAVPTAKKPTVSEEQPKHPPPLSPPPNKVNSQANWYYEANGQSAGPFDENAISALIKSGVIIRNTKVWNDTMADWAVASQSDLLTMINSMGPPPISKKPPQAPTYEASLQSVVQIEKREVLVVCLLSVFSLGLYAIYLIYLWAKEINALHGREKYPPVVALVASTLTLGLAGLFFECGFALDLTKVLKKYQVPERNSSLGITVILLNGIGIAVSLFSFGLLFYIGAILGVAATCIFQTEMNKLADHFSKPGGDDASSPPAHIDAAPKPPKAQSPLPSSIAPAATVANLNTTVQKSKKPIIIGGCMLAVFVLSILSGAFSGPDKLENEAFAFASCRRLHEAQGIYYRTDYDRDGINEYSQRLIGDFSLFETRDGAADVILITLSMANAGRLRGDPSRKPYYGYFFKIMFEQGPNAYEGTGLYLINGNLSAGYAVLAYPVEYGITGNNSYMVNKRGQVYQKDLGANTFHIAESMRSFNPDPSWVTSF